MFLLVTVEHFEVYMMSMAGSSGFVVFYFFGVVFFLTDFLIMIFSVLFIRLVIKIYSMHRRNSPVSQSPSGIARTTP